MQVSISSTLTILHDGQFWVGICERRDGALYGACRFVFGPEPADEDVLAFVRDQWGRLDFRMRAEGVAPSRNPKRAQREARKAHEGPAGDRRRLRGAQGRAPRLRPRATRGRGPARLRAAHGEAQAEAPRPLGGAPGRPEDARRGAASLGATRTERAMFWQKSGLFRPEAAV